MSEAMMGNPFFRNYWNSSHPRYPASARGIPVYQQETKPRSHSAKVVSIPVHFVESEKTRSAVALRIQKVFRGHLVRKNVKKIVAIKAEVEELERRISLTETVELVRRDNKERLRMNEMLMALLFRLDAVRGVDSGVRDFRKAVIRKAIALQEKLDAIVAGDQAVEKNNNDEEIDDPSSEKEATVDPSRNCESEEETGKDIIISNPADCSDDCGTADDLVPVESSVKDCNATVEIAENPDTLPDDSERNSETKFEDENSATVKAILAGETEVEPSSIEVSNEETENLENSPEKESESSIEENVERRTEKKEERMEMEQPQLVQGNETAESLAVNNTEKSKEREENTFVMEKMLKENAKLMGLVTQLCERNALQTQLISSLSQRVENLEKAFISEQLKRKKKRQEKTPDARKCGKKL